jgi:rRNA-processing protein FCF1
VVKALKLNILLIIVVKRYRLGNGLLVIYYKGGLIVETVVDQLLEIDRKARQSIDEAQQYYENTMQEIETERQDIAQRYTQRADEHIKQVSGIEEQARADACAELQASLHTLERALDDAFATNHEQWEDEMFRRIIGKEG